MNLAKMKYLFVTVAAAIIFSSIFFGCSELETDIPVPHKESVHGEGVMTMGHPNFHGNYLKNSDFSNCRQCHAQDFNGGNTGVSCINCHNSIMIHISSKDEVRDSVNSPNFHGNFIRHHDWDLTDCASCHGPSFDGGLSSPSCLPCHTSPGGPASCNTCHGSFDDPERIAPPPDINDNSSTEIKSVGAHSAHLYENKLGSSEICSSCHSVPQEINDPGHVDSDLPAEVIFQNTATAFGASNAVYDSSTATCSNTYCHGNFQFLRDSADAVNRFAYTSDRMTGTPQTLSWIQPDDSQVQCGSCHGLPPEGHIPAPITACYTCHQGVIDETGNIIDKSKHINGIKNARGL